MQTIRQIVTSINQTKLFGQTFIFLNWTNCQSLAIKFGDNLSGISQLVKLHVELLQVVLNVKRTLFRNSSYHCRSQHNVRINIIILIREFCIVVSCLVNLTNNLTSIRTSSILQLQVASSIVIDNTYLITFTGCLF